MLIIFDLDDTLVDTSGCIIPVKLEDALYRMIEAGLVVPNVSLALDMIKQLNQTSNSSRDTLIEFLQIHNADMRFLEIGVQEIYENISPELPIYPLECAQEVLNELSKNHRLALVTIGKEKQQLAKMEKAGIDSTIFSKIIVSEERDKKPHYQAIVQELGFSPSEVMVCGDRVAIDLTPAKELGFKTVHVRWGRGLNWNELKRDIDYTVLHLAEIKEIIATIMVSVNDDK